MFTGFVAIFIFPTVKDGIVSFFQIQFYFFLHCHQIYVYAFNNNTVVLYVNADYFAGFVFTLAQLGPSLPAGLKIATFDDYPWNHVLFGAKGVFHL